MPTNSASTTVKRPPKITRAKHPHFEFFKRKKAVRKSTKPVVIGKLEGRDVSIGFEGDSVSSEAGLKMLMVYGRHKNFFTDLADIIGDPRQSHLVIHQVAEMIEQIMSGDFCGHFDYKDHDYLRYEPIFQHIVRGEKRLKPGEQPRTLSSSSGLQRLTEGFQPGGRTAKEMRALQFEFCRFLVKHFAATFDVEPKELILDIDGTDAKAHGNQEAVHYNGHYQHNMLMMQLLYCNQMPLFFRLLPGSCQSQFEALEIIKFVITELRKYFPNTVLICRGDSAYTIDDIMTWLEAIEQLGDNVKFVFAVKTNKRIEQMIIKEERKLQQLVEARKKSQTKYLQIEFQTLKSWSTPRRVVIKLECKYNPTTLQAAVHRHYVVTNYSRQEKTMRHVHKRLYCPRGNMENWLKASKIDMNVGQVSLTKLASNEFRNLLKIAAHGLLELFRRDHLQGTFLEHSTVATIREKFIKIGAVIIDTYRDYRISLAASCPNQDAIMKIIRRVLKQIRPRAGPIPA